MRLVHALVDYDNVTIAVHPEMRSEDVATKGYKKNRKKEKSSY